MELTEQLRSIARAKDKLDSDGASLTLDSMSLIDFVLAIEAALGVQIDDTDLTEENFRTIDTVAHLVEQLRGS
jgi:acyl carrier protein